MVRYNELKGLYDIEKTIGCGGFAKVKLATHLATGEKVAIKIMNKSVLGDDLPRVKLELRALKSMSHQHICKLYQVIETETHYFIVIEYCSGGELFDHIVEKNRLSESESRSFFRQIVSAVAYLHSLGYAHRDLKPENVLLDKDQNLKLIDFGLCAKPEGGIANPLFTSCGSPTYAAPELILGKKYLGPEVDVWAMGVLLYALLVGSLPFDDLNIDNLYKKILNGKYDVPHFLSADSVSLIRSMLQVDPKKRITINELLSHKWITLGILDPVDYRSRDSQKYDIDCVNILASSYNVESEKMWRHLRKWKYDYYTATYFLLLEKKRRGVPLKLNQSANNSKAAFEGTPIKKRKPEPLIVIQPPENVENKEVKVTTPSTPYFDCKFSFDNVENVNTSAKKEFLEPQRPTPGRKPQKRLRSPTLNIESSPVPTKKTTIGTKSTPKTPERKRSQASNSSETPGSARRVLGSIERSLHKVRDVLTPKRPQSGGDAAIQPAVLSSKSLCNVSTTQCNDPEYVITELSKAFQKKGFHCERKGFTLRGKVEANVLHSCNGCSFELEICYLPCMGPSSCVVSATTPIVSSLPRSQVCDTPPKSILKNGIINNSTPTNANSNNLYVSTPCNNAKLLNNNNNSSSKKKDNKLNDLLNKEKSFAFIGIKRKRLKGDSWCYKKVCEEVLAVATKDLRPPTESAV